jgi:hypothetical protein
MPEIWHKACPLSLEVLGNADLAAEVDRRSVKSDLRQIAELVLVDGRVGLGETASESGAESSCGGVDGAARF